MLLITLMILGTITGSIIKADSTSSLSYYFPYETLSRENKVDELAQYIINIFNLSYNNSEPWKIIGSWNQINNYTLYIYNITDYNKLPENINIDFKSSLKIYYYNGQFYFLELNSQWRKFNNPPDNVKFIANSLDIKFYYNMINGSNYWIQKELNKVYYNWTKIFDKDHGFNDTNYISYIEQPIKPNYNINVEFWGLSTTIIIASWLNNINNYREDFNYEKILDEKTQFVINNFRKCENMTLIHKEYYLINNGNTLIQPLLQLNYYFQYKDKTNPLYDPEIIYQVQLITTIDGNRVIERNEFNLTSSEKPWDDFPSTYNNESNKEYLWIIIIISLSLVIIVIVLLFIIIIKKEKNLFDNINRDQIYKLIKNNQGIHFRDIMHQVNIKQGVLGYHLNLLEREGLVKSIQKGNKRCFFTCDEKGEYRLQLNIAQQKILNEINLNPGINLSNLSKIIYKPKTLIYYHLAILLDIGLIIRQKDGREINYFISELGKKYIN